jgi:hypothetical protein
MSSAHLMPSPALPSDAPATVLPLSTEITLFCEICCECMRFLVTRECAYGLVGTCSSCGDERVSPFTRTPSDSVQDDTPFLLRALAEAGLTVRDYEALPMSEQSKFVRRAQELKAEVNL